MPPALPPDRAGCAGRSAHPASLHLPARAAWVEIDLARLHHNYEVIRQDAPSGTNLLAVVKDEGYGHGGVAVARTALDAGASFLAVGTLEEAAQLRDNGIHSRLLILGDRQESELSWCAAQEVTCCVSERSTVATLARLGEKLGRRIPVHLKINTGLNRYGVRWDQASALAQFIHSHPTLELEGALSHFAQADEADASFALQQLARFNQALAAMADSGISIRLRHLCNSAGFLNLPQARFEMVRVGLLGYGVYPSADCRRLPGISPAMTVKARVAALQELQAGDSVSYGRRFVAPNRRRIAVLPLGYGDGFPRISNQGFVLLHGRRAPIVGNVTMDSVMIDVTELPEIKEGDETVLLGQQGNEEITAHEIAQLKHSISYDILTNWRARLPRVYLERKAATAETSARFERMEMPNGNLSSARPRPVDIAN